ncbi:MAG: hypothetical protein JXR37_37120 [Kiritimatiellae bacterium]|nr:hypothetical protein [Kiritimatiellia bacterium]
MPLRQVGKLKDLVVVSCHASLKQEFYRVPEQPEREEVWVLKPFQVGEVPFLIEHMRRGVALTANNPEALLVFSGGRSRLESGPWSEAKSYLEVTKQAQFWIPEKYKDLRDSVAKRTVMEGFARDSFENLLFGICRFQQATRQYPRTVTVVGWEFKSKRFELHRDAIRWPGVRYRYDGVNEPVKLRDAQHGESELMRQFAEHQYGAGGPLLERRKRRNPYNEQHPYAACPDMKAFFTFIAKPENGTKEFKGKLPWD